MTTYNGFTNYETWNISLWIENDYDLYLAKEDYKKTTNRPSYTGLVRYLDLNGKTPDGVGWNSRKLNRKELTESLFAD